MLSCNYFKGYVHVRRGLLISRKKYNNFCFKSVCYSKAQRSEIFAQNNYLTSNIEITEESNKNAISRNVTEMRLRDFLNCFYVSGWVPLHLMNECLSNILASDSFNNELGSIFLRCCGHTLVTCEKKTRLNITNTVWNNLSRVADLGHDQYHILLNVDAENSFYRTEVLPEMEKGGLQPNQTTYELLLQSASESNNKAAFNDVKLLMEREKATLNENFFSSLIRLHTLNKNLNEIESIEKNFQGSEARPLAITFALMRAYASLNQYNLLLNLAEGIVSSDQALRSNQLAQVIAELAHNVPKDKVIKFVYHINALGLRMAVKDVNWLTAYLTSRDLEDLAFDLLSKMSWEDLPAIHMDSPPATLVSLMCAHWEKGKKPEVLLEVLNAVEDSMHIPWTMETALYGALRQQNSGSAWIVLEEMHRTNRAIRPHYFWPLLLNTSHPKEMFDVIKKMFEYGTRPDTATLKSFVIERLLTRGVDPTYLGDRLVHAGVRTKEVVLAFDVYFLEVDQMDLALQRASRPKFEGSTELVEALTKAYIRNQDDQSMISFLKILQTDRRTKTDWVGQVVLDVYTKSPQTGEHLLKNIHSGGIRISADLKVLINAIREQARVDPGIRTNDIKESEEPGNWPRVFSGTYLHPKQMNVEELENHLIELRAKGMNTRTVLRKLFLMHTDKRNIKRSKELLDDLLGIPNVEWSAAMLGSRMYLHAMLGETEESLQIYYEIKKNFRHFTVDVYKITALAESLVRDNRMKDALNILGDLPDSSAKYQQKDLTSFLVLIKTFIEKDISINDLDGIINLLINKRYVTPSNPIMGSYVDYYLRRGDHEGAVKEFQNLHKRYGLYPNKFELLSALHTAKIKGKLNNFDKLKGVVVNILKQSQSYHLLDELLPAANAGDKQEVLSIMKRISVSRSWKPFDWQCKQWAITSNVIPLELILSCCQELKDKETDLSTVAKAIADEYYYQGDSKKLTELFTTISKKEITVSPEIHRFVDKLTRSCGLLKGKQP